MDIAQITKILKIISKSTEKPLLKSKSMGIAKKSYSNTPRRSDSKFWPPPKIWRQILGPPKNTILHFWVVFRSKQPLSLLFPHRINIFLCKLCIQSIMHKCYNFVAINALFQQICWHFPSMKFTSFRFSNITYSGMLPNHLQIFALVHQAAPKCCNLCLNVILPLKKLDSSIHWLKFGFYIHSGKCLQHWRFHIFFFASFNSKFWYVESIWNPTLRIKTS